MVCDDKEEKKNPMPRPKPMHANNPNLSLANQAKVPNKLNRHIIKIVMDLSSSRNLTS